MKEKTTERYSDDRGDLFFTSPKILNFDYKYLTFGTLKSQAYRGGHYHKRIEEKLMCIKGKLIFKLDEKEIEIEAGDIVDIPKGTVHTIFNKDDEYACFIEFKSEEFDENDKDTFLPEDR